MPTPQEIYQQTLASQGQAAADIAYQKALLPQAEAFASVKPAVSAPPPIADTLGFTAPKISPISSTLPMREKEKFNQVAAGETMKELSNLEKQIAEQAVFAGTTAGQKAEQALAEAEARFRGVLTAEERSAVEAEARSAGAEFEPLISEAVEQRRRQLPRALVEAGERGGFLSTQFAGAAALEPVAGDSFIGAGGELANIENAYNSAIQNLRGRQIEAMRSARIAAGKAVRSGRKEDLELAQNIFKEAKSNYEAEQKLLGDKVDKLTKIESERRQQAQEIRLSEQALAGTRQKTFEKIQDLSKSGFDPSSYSADELLNLDKEAGLVSGTTQKLLQVGFESKNLKTIENKIEATGKIIDILKDIPAGVEIPIGGSVFTGMKQGNNKIFSETDNQGNVSFITLDPAGNILNIAQGKGVGKRKIGGAGVGQADFSASLSALQANRGPDGFANTKIYSDLLDAFRAKGQAQKFLSNFPPEDFLNPQDQTAKKFFQTPRQAVTDTSSNTIDALIESSL